MPVPITPTAHTGAKTNERSTRTARSLEPELPALRRRLMRMARLSVRDRGAAEDLVHDALVSVVERHSTWRGDCTLQTWATAIFKNKVADWHRASARRGLLQTEADLAPEDSNDDAPDAGDGAAQIPVWQQPENLVERRQLADAMARCAQCLPARSRRVFEMRDWLGLETDEICDQLGVSAENCRTMLHRARATLRACLERTGHGMLSIRT